MYICIKIQIVKPSPRFPTYFDLYLRYSIYIGRSLVDQRSKYLQNPEHQHFNNHFLAPYQDFLIFFKLKPIHHFSRLFTKKKQVGKYGLSYNFLGVANKSLGKRSVTSEPSPSSSALTVPLTVCGKCVLA